VDDENGETVKHDEMTNAERVNLESEIVISHEYAVPENYYNNNNNNNNNHFTAISISRHLQIRTG